MSPLKSSKIYSGIDRRSTSERRKGAERRNLFRYESIGSERRATVFRRNEDTFWLRHKR